MIRSNLWTYRSKYTLNICTGHRIIKILEDVALWLSNKFMSSFIGFRHQIWFIIRMWAKSKLKKMFCTYSKMADTHARAIDCLRCKNHFIILDEFNKYSFFNLSFTFAWNCGRGRHWQWATTSISKWPSNYFQHKPYATVQCVLWWWKDSSHWSNTYCGGHQKLQCHHHCAE